MEKFNTTKEEDVGITQFINMTNKGFKSVLKHRYSDFIVNEINPEGKVIWIKETASSIQQEVLNEKASSVSTETVQDVLSEEKVDQIIKEVFAPMFPLDDDVSKLNSFIVNYINKLNAINDSIELSYIEDKNKRRDFHEAIRNNFNFLDTETKEDKTLNTKSLLVKYVTNKSFYKRRKVFPDKNKKCLHFSMMKRNLDTVSAINYIARMLHRSPKTIKFAGNKDKRGITTQCLSSYNTLPNEILSAMANRNWNKNIELGNFSFSDNELRLGLLKGNQFSVVLRFIQNLNENENTDLDWISHLDKVINDLKINGFVNYFGMQRFGVSSIPTHFIGKYVIKKQWKEAFINILSNDCVYNALEQLGIKSRDLSECVFGLENEKSIISNLLKIIPYYMSENKLLYNYTKSGKNSFQSSFRGLNKQLQVLYPHAYQSYIWNQTVSYRIKEMGLKLYIGDIVKKHSATIEEINQEDCDCSVDNGEDKDTKPNEEQQTESVITNEKPKEKLDKIFTDNYEFITEENINKYTIADLVIPIVGYEVYYPKNQVQKYIEELLEKDGLSFKDFNYQCVNFNSTGYFRKIIEKPMEMNYSLIHHDDPDEDLQTEYYNLNEHPALKGTKYTSLRIQFQLPQSTYATMLFRELTKHSSAGNYQATLSMNIQKEDHQSNPKDS